MIKLVKWVGIIVLLVVLAFQSNYIQGMAFFVICLVVGYHELEDKIEKLQWRIDKLESDNSPAQPYWPATPRVP